MTDFPLAHAEAHALACFDLDRLAGVRVAPEARLAILDFEGSEAGDRHRPLFAQPLADALEDRVQEARRRQFRGVHLVGDLGDEIALVHGVEMKKAWPLRTRDQACFRTLGLLATTLPTLRLLASLLGRLLGLLSTLRHTVFSPWAFVPLQGHHVAP